MAGVPIAAAQPREVVQTMNGMRQQAGMRAGAGDTTAPEIKESRHAGVATGG